MNIAKWTISIIAVAALIFGAIQTSFLRQDMTEQKAILSKIQTSQTEMFAELEQGQNKLIEESKAFEDKLLSATMDAREHQPFGVVWSYGTGLPGSDSAQLNYPTCVEEIDGRSIIISDSLNYRVIMVDKLTGEIIWTFSKSYGESNFQPSSAHYIKSGDYSGDYLIAGRHHDGINWNGHAFIVDSTGTVKWEFNVAKEDFGDAIIWDSDNVMISYQSSRTIHKIRLSDKSDVWTYGPMPASILPVYLQRLPNKDVYLGSFGGDLLFGTSGSLVREIDTSDSSIKWEYGGKSTDGWGGGEFTYENPQAPMCALRLGSGEHVENSEALTIICAFQSCTIFAVTRDKTKVWQIGGITPGASTTLQRDPSPQGGILLHTPFFVSPTKSGNMLIADALGHKVVEIVPHFVPLRQSLETWIFGSSTTNDWKDSEIIETRWFGKKNVIVMNTHESNTADWRLLGSPDANNWIEIKKPVMLEGGKSTYHLIEEPWAFIKAQVKSSIKDAPSTISIYAHCLRE